MTMPPRAVERVLESLGASPDAVEEVVGDLAEEFELRVEEGDAQGACVWYYREALCAVPYLVRDALRRASLRDVRRGLSLGLGALGLLYAIGIVLGLVGLTGYAVATRLGMPHLPRLSALAPGALAAVGLTFGVLNGAAGGYIAVRIDRRALLGSALGFGLIATCEFVGAGLLFGGGAPLWYRVAGVLALNLGALVGGALRVATRDVSARRGA